MAKTDRLADAVQAYFYEVKLAPGHSHRRADEIQDEMYAALIELRPEAAEGPAQPEPPSVAPSIPQDDEDVNEDA